ncbi:MAG: DUF393 domain-containing protein [Chlamydiales bacterium]|nr:DUF393 domain-containing protein [Chlamydiales bacterium]NCF70181.1 DUF393 domain-containing protein [Chlamydiales bacterium]
MTGGAFSFFRIVWGMLHAIIAVYHPATFIEGTNWGFLITLATSIFYLLLAAGFYTRQLAFLSLLLLSLQMFYFYDLTSINFWVHTLATLLMIIAPDSPHLSWNNRNNIDPQGNWNLSQWSSRLFTYSATLPLALPLTSLLFPSYYLETFQVPLFFPSHLVLQSAFCLLSVYLLTCYLIKVKPVLHFYLFSAWLVLFIIGATTHTGLYSNFISLSIIYLACSQHHYPQEKLTLFYDGQCGLCHGAVRFLLAEAQLGSILFTPQQDPYYQKKQEQLNSPLPDSIIAQKEGSDELLSKSSALILTTPYMNPCWQFLAFLLSFIPRLILDKAYDYIAKWRKSLLPTPNTLCPLTPAKYKFLFRSKN